VSVPDVAAFVNLPSLVPSVVSTPPSGMVVRWLLHLTTGIIFAVATLLGVGVALTAPTESPPSVGEPRR
jgi:hypothetical protein